jgi:hypothetical protein
MFVGQRGIANQRRGRYVTASAAHPARMAPDLAAAVIEDYTRPGDLVLDPLAGTGTALVEAVHAGRNAVGVEIDPGWVAIARANLTLARRQGAGGHGRVIRGDATRLPTGVPIELRGQVTMVLTSPPSGNAMPRGSSGTSRVHLIHGMTAVFAGCVPLLGAGGLIVVVARPSRRAGRLIDMSGVVTTAASIAGLTLIDRRVAIGNVARDERGVGRARSWERGAAEPTGATSAPISVRRHDDVTVFAATGTDTETSASGYP